MGRSDLSLFAMVSGYAVSANTYDRALSAIISIYHPYREAPESKAAKWIEDKLPNKNKLTYYRKLRQLSKKQLFALSGVNIRSLNYYEADRQYLWKAKGETLYALAKTLCCTIEDLLH